MKILLTGADGVLGNNLVRLLLDKGYTVKVLIQSGRRAVFLEELPIEIVSGDILVTENVDDAVRGCDIVIHAAAKTDTYPTRDKSYWDINVEGTRNIISAVKKYNVKKLLHVGTANSFGPGTIDNPGTEKNPYNGDRYRLDYMSSKYKAQRVLLGEIRDNNLKAIILNPTFMIGPYDSKPSSGAMILAVNSGKVPGYPPGGRNFVYVGDVATAIVNAIELGRIGEAYILGHENLNYKEIFSKMSTILGVKAPGMKMPGWATLAYGRIMSGIATVFRMNPGVCFPLALISTEDHYYTSGKAITELNMPQTPITEAIKESVSWFKENGYIKN
ncbi:MAG: NAD-dependent epimerase/dehydratase family protein [Bacteroidales bacterium]|nr:NAD-dependent epimerase/dehydratase family protein [Bacteroidales bacterium]